MVAENKAYRKNTNTSSTSGDSSGKKPQTFQAWYEMDDSENEEPKPVFSSPIVKLAIQLAVLLGAVGLLAPLFERSLSSILTHVEPPVFFGIELSPSLETAPVVMIVMSILATVYLILALWQGYYKRHR